LKELEQDFYDWRNALIKTNPSLTWAFDEFEAAVRAHERAKVLQSDAVQQLKRIAENNIRGCANCGHSFACEPKDCPDCKTERDALAALDAAMKGEQ
jgi:rubrerythrin